MIIVQVMAIMMNKNETQQIYQNQAESKNSR